jgi:ribosomal protein S12 methylthiotransferase
MPLQHINSLMLKRMHRLGDRPTIERLVDRIRSRIPGVTFRTAFIVGFPGETDEAFQELKSYVEQAEFDRVAVFLYSDEEGTPAAGLGEKVDRALMEERRNELLAVQDSIAAAKHAECIGSTLDVMVDGPAEEEGYWMEGRHEGLAPEIDGVVYIVGSEDQKRAPRPGESVKVRITEATTYDLVGHVVGKGGTAPRGKPGERGPRGGYR